MQTAQADYFGVYHNLKVTRDANRVLIAEFHSNGEPFIMSAPAHMEFADAFYRIAQDRANKIVILTGAGGEFIPDVDRSTCGDVAEPRVRSQLHDEGPQVLENIANMARAGHRGDRWTRACALIRATCQCNGHVNGRYLDDKLFWPVFECADDSRRVHLPAHASSRATSRCRHGSREEIPVPAPAGFLIESVGRPREPATVFNGVADSVGLD
jgi:hypothetical protein